jgi:hypothetical protein
MKMNANQRKAQSLFLQAVALLHPDEDEEEEDNDSDDEENDEKDDSSRSKKEEDDDKIKAQAATALHECIALLSTSSSLPPSPYPATLDNPTHLHYCALLELGRLLESSPSSLPTSSSSSLPSSFYRRAVALSSEKVEPLLLLGMARKREGGREEGREVLREAVRKAEEGDEARRRRRRNKKEGGKKKKRRRRANEEEEEEEKDEDEVAREEEAGRQARLQLAMLLLQSATGDEDEDEDEGGNEDEMKQQKQKQTKSSSSSSSSRGMSNIEQEADTLLHSLSFTYRLSTSLWSYRLSFPPALPPSLPPSLPSSSFLHISDQALPPSLLREMQNIFCPPLAPFWQEHNYYSEKCGYFSYLMKLEGEEGREEGVKKGGKMTKKKEQQQQQQQQQQKTNKKGMNAVEATIHRLFLHLLPLLPPSLKPKKGGKAGGREGGRGVTHAEWWCHTREEGSGHALHFDTDEMAIKEEGERGGEGGREGGG